MEFTAMNGISYISLDDEMLQLMRRAGFSQLNLALVSSDKTVRETTKRPHTLDAYLNVIGQAHGMGFKTVSYQILGLPNESLASMVQTLAFNTRLPVLLGASPFYLTPESPIARGRNLTEIDYIRSRLTAMAVETKSCSRDDLYTLFITTRIINFLKGLDLPGDADIADLLQQTWAEHRTAIGFELLRELAGSHVLNFRTAQGLIPNRRFKTELFLEVLKQAESVCCQNGRRIYLDANFARSPPGRFDCGLCAQS
jgi:radical SAM superfamily enzyme YgiQ (UPF0313 family)